MRNKYIFRSRISEKKFREILRLFCFDIEAVKIAKMTGVSRPTINKMLKAIRQRIAEVCEESSPFSGQIEVDESYFGARRVKGKRGRGASGKTIVFGIFKRDGKVYTEIVLDVAKKTLQGIIRGKVELDSVIHSDQWRGYNGLVDLGYKKHFRVNHGEDEFVNDHSHINGIEGFWELVKNRLTKFKDIHKHTFYLHLKESEFRYNFRTKNTYKFLLALLKKYPLKLS